MLRSANTKLGALVNARLAGQTAPNSTLNDCLHDRIDLHFDHFQAIQYPWQATPLRAPWAEARPIRASKSRSFSQRGFGGSLHSPPHLVFTDRLHVRLILQPARCRGVQNRWQPTQLLIVENPVKSRSYDVHEAQKKGRFNYPNHHPQHHVRARKNRRGYDQT